MPTAGPWQVLMARFYVEVFIMENKCMGFVWDLSLLCFIKGLVFNCVKSVHRFYYIIVYNGFNRGNINKHVGKWNLWVVENVELDFNYRVSFLCI